jgi:hypothetical protein
MELILLMMCAFVFFFGSAIMIQVMEFSFLIGDKVLCACGQLAKWLSITALKMIGKLFSITFSKANLYRMHRVTIQPFLTVKHVAIPYAPNSKLGRSVNREPVIIEHPPQQTK